MDHLKVDERFKEAVEGIYHAALLKEQAFYFDKIFIEKTQVSKTYEEAYLMVEAERKKYFPNSPCYANYDSYRKSRSRRIKST